MVASTCSSQHRISWLIGRVPALLHWILCATTTIALGTSPAHGQQGDEAAAIAAARRGGVVILCRHGMTDPVDENEATLAYDDPSTQRRLNAEGERQASAMGGAFDRLGVRAAEVIASPMQRARRTAELMFGRATLDSSWHTRGSDYTGLKRERRRSALSTPVANGNRVIVTHLGTLGDAIRPLNPGLEEGDCVVVRPQDPAFTYLGKVRWRAWLSAAERR
jgi:phosphohistidine phosphatase SixA